MSYMSRYWKNTVDASIVHTQSRFTRRIVPFRRHPRNSVHASPTFCSSANSTDFSVITKNYNYLSVDKLIYKSSFALEDRLEGAGLFRDRWRWRSSWRCAWGGWRSGMVAVVILHAIVTYVTIGMHFTFVKCGGGAVRRGLVRMENRRSRQVADGGKSDVLFWRPLQRRRMGGWWIILRMRRVTQRWRRWVRRVRR